METYGLTDEQIEEIKNEIENMPIKSENTKKLLLKQMIINKAKELGLINQEDDEE